MKISLTLDTSSRTFQTFFTFSLFTFSILLLGTATYSWTNPSGTAPNNNVAAPVNVSSSSQVKSGPLQVNGFLNTGSTVLSGPVGIGLINPSQQLEVGGNVRADGFCIGGSCITSWPSGGVSQNTVRSCTDYSADSNGRYDCTVSCLSGYYRTGCSAGGNWNVMVTPSGSNGCTAYTTTDHGITVYAYCAR